VFVGALGCLLLFGDVVFNERVREVPKRSSMNLKHSVAFLILAAMLFCLPSAGANEVSDAQEGKADNKTTAKPADVQRITVEELKEMIAKSLPVTIIDARSAGSYDSTTTKIKGAIRMATEEIPSHLKDLPRDREVVTYCT
jgi:hypothetical protein